ncbi:hypothetical protein RIF24_14185 [Exiguobacterium acetylicum]|uniref:hypothetical protein n=1 Tax=Exiguobacterium acetylicum TaxID=41170 RepID=UPI00397778C9
MKNDTYICGVFYSESLGEESEYKNIKSKSSSSNFQNIYWESMIVMFSSVAKTNPDAKKILFINKVSSNKRHIELLKKLSVEIVEIEYLSKPPKNHWKAWQSTFFILDALNYLKDKVQKDDFVYFLDLDCLVLKDFRDINRVLKKDKILNYVINYADSDVVHENLVIDMKKSYATALNIESEKFNYHGGEIYGVYGNEMLNKLYLELKISWEKSLNEKKINFNTEEYLFNYVFMKNNWSFGNANNFVKRIWTDSSSFRNVEDSDMNLTIWHVPAEKNYGLRKIYKYLADDKKANDFFHTKSEYKINEFFGKFLSIPTLSYKDNMIQKIKKNIKKLKDVIK